VKIIRKRLSTLYGKLGINPDNELLGLCRLRNVAIQTIKSIAQRPWEKRLKTYNTCYEPLDQDTIDKSLKWVLDLPLIFLITAGDMQHHPKILEAAKRVGKRRSDSEINAITDEFENRLISFEYRSIVIYTSG